MINAASSDYDESRIVLQLRGFHTIVSFFGSIGHLMDGSGLKEVMELIYAGDNVPLMLNGKEISRPIRAHQLVDPALHAMLLGGDSSMNIESALIDESYSIDLQVIFQELLDQTKTAEQYVVSPVLD